MNYCWRVRLRRDEVAFPCSFVEVNKGSQKTFATQSPHKTYYAIVKEQIENYSKMGFTLENHQELMKNLLIFHPARSPHKK